MKQGKIVEGTRRVLGRTGIGVGVREGAPKPDISTVEAFKRTLLDAKSVLYSGVGSSGVYFLFFLLFSLLTSYPPAPPSKVTNSRRFTARCLPCFPQKE